jgi:hypothetical protein
MGTSGTVWLIIALLLLAAIAYVVVRFGQASQLRRTFGAEYRRAVEETGSRSAAHAELKRRRQEHARLNIRALTPEQKARYRDQWTAVQQEFISDPVGAVQHAEQLVSAVVADRGYPRTDHRARVALMSVEHGNSIQHYREAHYVAAQSAGNGQVATEELRRSLVHYRAMLSDLLGENLANDLDDEDHYEHDATMPPTEAPTTEVGHDSRRMG